MDTDRIHLEFIPDGKSRVMPRDVVRRIVAKEYGFTRESVQDAAKDAMTAGKRPVPDRVNNDVMYVDDFEVRVTHTCYGFVRYYAYIVEDGALRLRGEMAHDGAPTLYSHEVHNAEGGVDLIKATPSSRVNRGWAFALLVFAALSPKALWKETWAPSMTAVLSNM